METQKANRTIPPGSDPANASDISDANIGKIKSKQKRSGTMGEWQKSLLPFMIAVIIVLSGFFLAASYIQFSALSNQITNAPKMDLTSAVAVLDVKNDDNMTNADRLAFAQWKTLAALEEHAMERRYYQAGVMLKARIWTRYLGFITGMILAIVGAVFVLGRLRETAATIDTSSALWKMSMTTASPGIILAVLGTLLIFTTMVTTYEVNVKDEQLFTNVALPSASSESSPTPLPQPKLFRSPVQQEQK